MDAEIFMDEAKLVVAKEGFDASNPSLPEGDKLFDSDWLFAGTIVQAGLHVDNADYRLDKKPYPRISWNEPTNWSNVQVINFTPLPYVPTILLIPLSDSRYWHDQGMVLLGADKRNRNFGDEYYRTGEITVSNSQIRIPRCYSKVGKWHFREDFMFLIMAM